MGTPLFLSGLVGRPSKGTYSSVVGDGEEDVHRAWKPLQEVPGGP